MPITEGDWEVDTEWFYHHVGTGESMREIRSVTGEQIARVFIRNGEGNAYAIATLPEIVRALEHLLDDYEREWGSELVDDWYPDVRAALAKVRGE